MTAIGTDADALSVELTAEGNLRLTAEVAQRYFPHDALVAQRRDRELWLLPLVGPEAGGLLLKQRNAAGDRSTIIREVVDDGSGMVPVTGRLAAFWDADAGALRVDVSPDLPDDGHTR